MTKKVRFKVIDRKMFQEVIDRKVLPKGQLPKLLLRGRVIYRKMLSKKRVAEIFMLKKKTIIGVSINKNSSVEKIIGRLVVQKRVCGQKLLQKVVGYRNVFDTEKLNNRTGEDKEFMTINIVFRNSLSKNCC